MKLPPENENGPADVRASADPNTFGPLSETSGSLNSTPSALGGRILEIACPGDSSVPLHFADYWPKLEVLNCIRCGVLTSAEICTRVEEEWANLDLYPTTAEDEEAAREIATQLLRALPGQAVFAAEAAVALCSQRFAGRLSQQHLARCIETAFLSLKEAA